MNKKINVYSSLIIFFLFVFAIGHYLQYNGENYENSALIDIEVTLFILVLVTAILNTGHAIICAVKQKWGQLLVSLQWIGICLAALVLVMIIDAPTLWHIK